MSDPTQPDGLPPDPPTTGYPPVAPPPAAAPPPAGYAPPGYPPPGYPPPGYAAPGWGTGPYGPAYGPVQQDHPKGVTVLVLGILSIVVCQILGPVAIVMGRNALREIDAAPPGTYANRGLVQAGWICGIVGTVLLVIWVAYVVVVFGLIALVSLGSSSA